MSTPTVSTTLTTFSASRLHYPRSMIRRAIGVAPRIGITTTARTTTCFTIRQQRKNAPQKAPLPINAYSLLTSGPPGPIPSSPTASTSTLFCQRSPTPSGSWNGSDPKSGILWAIEHQNADNPNHIPIDCAGSRPPTNAALHAFNATDLRQELYTSRSPNAPTGNPTKFSTPTIFNSRVYVGAQTEVDVFGLTH